MWTAGVAVEIFGVRVGLRCDDAELLRAAIDMLPPGWTPSTSPLVDFLFSVRAGGPGNARGVRRYYLLYEGALRVVRTLERDELLDRLASAVRLVVADSAPEHVFVHAGVVGWRGSAIVLPGATFTGKTSLVVELIRAGATYYSDDCALLDDQGWVHPYPEPLAIRDRPVARQTRRAAEDMQATVGQEALPIGLIAFTRYTVGASWRPRRLSAARAMLALLGHASSVRRRPEAVMEILRRATRGAVVLSGARGGARETAERLLHHWHDGGVVVDATRVSHGSSTRPSDEVMACIQPDVRPSWS